MSHIPGSLSEYHRAVGTERPTKADIAGWRPAAFFAAMVLVLIVSMVLFSAIGYK